MKAKDDVHRVLTYLKNHQMDLEGFLKSLLQIETPSKSATSQHKILNYLQNEFESLGFYCIQVRGRNTGGYLFARPKERHRELPLQLIVGHCDTVWPKGTLNDMPIVTQDGKLRGPGVYDMKAGITQAVFAIKAIQDLNLVYNVIPIIFINSDEEIGSHESTHIIKLLSKISIRAFVLEPPLGLEGKLKTARKGVGRFLITVKGKAAHAGLDPAKGISAILELSYQIQKLYAMNDPEKGITVNVGMVAGGISANVIAPESKAVVDVRVLNEMDGLDISKKIKSLSPMTENVFIHIEGGIGRPPMESNERNQGLWKLAKAQGKYLGLNLKQGTAGGGSDGNTTSQFTATLDGLGTPGDGAHAKHEFIFKNQIKDRTALLAALLLSEPIQT